jgi:DNA polymerase-3 subunit chi
MLPTRVDFYILTSSEPKSRLLLACRLLEKAYLSRQRVFVFCNDHQSAKVVDNLLWTFKDDSFIPHTLQGDESDEGLVSKTIHIGYCNTPPPDTMDILLNLTDRLPVFYSSFPRIIELVINTEAAKALSREHYRKFRDEQYELYTHSID